VQKNFRSVAIAMKALLGPGVLAACSSSNTPVQRDPSGAIRSKSPVHPAGLEQEVAAHRARWAAGSAIILACFGTGTAHPGGISSSLSITPCTVSTCELRAEPAGQPASPARVPDASKPQTYKTGSADRQPATSAGSPSLTPTDCAFSDRGGTCIGLNSAGLESAGAGRKAGGDVSPKTGA
jgi:hypothetical protein